MVISCLNYHFLNLKKYPTIKFSLYIIHFFIITSILTSASLLNFSDANIKYIQLNFLQHIQDLGMHMLYFAIKVKSLAYNSNIERAERIERRSAQNARFDREDRETR